MTKIQQNQKKEAQKSINIKFTKSLQVQLNKSKLTQKMTKIQDFSHFAKLLRGIKVKNNCQKSPKITKITFIKGFKK